MVRRLTESIRVSIVTKTRLDDIKGVKTYDYYISKMLDYFEQTGYNPRHSVKNPTAAVEKRVEDLVRIIKSQERDILKPIYSKVMDDQGSADNKEQLIRLAEENQKLMKQLRELKVNNDQDSELAKKKLRSLVMLIVSQCDPSKFNTTTLGSDLKVPRSFFEQLIKKVQEDYVL